MTEIDLDALEATARAAAAGPWHHTPFGGQNQNGDYFGGDVFDGHGEYLLSEVRDEDGAHIAAFEPTTALSLIARLREAETVIGAIDAIEPMWPRGMYGAPQDMIGRNQIRPILSRYKTTKTENGGTPKRRLRSCVEQWPECETGDYDPACCRFPKSCSATVYDDDRVTDADLEPVTDRENGAP